MITIGLPFFNDSRYLEMAIRSVINQTYQDWVLLLVDDGSSDGSLDIAKKYAEKDSRISVISDGENKKLPYRLNQIAQLTKTPYLARMDADDIMHPERIEKQLNLLIENPSFDVLGSNVYIIDGNNIVVGVRKNISHELMLVKGFIHPSIIARTQWFLENPYDEKAARSQDALLWEVTKNKSNFVITNLPLLYYREIGGLYYKKYWRSAKSSLAILLSKTSSCSSSYLVNKTFSLAIKSLVYYTASLVGKEDYFLRKRNKGFLSVQDKQVAEKTLQAALEAVK